MHAAPARILPWWLVAVVVVAAALLGTLALEVTGSAVVAAVVSAASLPLASAARRWRATSAGKRRPEELPSGSYFPHASLGRALAAQLVPLLAVIAVWGAVGTVLEQLTGSWNIALVFILILASMPVWFEADHRMGIRSARRQLDEQRNLRALAERERGRAATASVELPLARGRIALLAGCFVAAAGVCGMWAAAASEDRVGLIACAIVFGTIGVIGARQLRAPVFVRVGPDGIDPLGRGWVPWTAIRSLSIYPGGSQRWLAIWLEDERPQDEPWWRRGHRGLGRTMHNQALVITLRFCGAGDDVLMSALQGYEDKPLDVDLA